MSKALKENIWLFVIGSFLGFLLETFWHYFKYQEFINKQGLLYGPFKPIYGLGLIIIIYFMKKLQTKSLLKQFIYAVLIGSIFEYLASLFQEYIWGTSTWNYTNFKLNIAGRVYLPYSLAWGFLSLGSFYLLYPLIKKFLTNHKLTIITILLGLFMSLNISLTILATKRYASKESTSIFALINDWYPDEYMIKKFPQMKVVKKS